MPETSRHSSPASADTSGNPSSDAILRYAADGIIAINADGVITFSNPAARQMLGWNGDAGHDDSHDRLHAGSYCPTDCAIVATLRDGISRTGELIAAGKSAEYRCSPILQDGNVAGCVVTIAPPEVARPLGPDAPVPMFGRMASTLAHEFNNVLMGIQPFAEVVRRNTTAEEKLQKAATQILASVARGRKLTEEVVRGTRSGETKPQSIDVGEWLRRIEPQIVTMMGERIAVHFVLPAEAVVGRFDPDQLQQVMLNLAANARDAMADGGSLTIEAGVSATPSMVSISLRDDGPGIAAELLPSVFTPLFTTKRSRLGLGLAVAKHQVIQNGGTIAVTSMPGAGAAFTILLPLPPPDLEQKRVTMPAQRLLLVEDDPDIAAGLSALLTLDGFDVRVAENGMDALRAIEESLPDAVVLDITLPDLSGAEVYERIAARWPTLPVIFSSGHGDAAGLSKPLENSHVLFLPKPYSVDTLVAALRRVVP